MGLMDTGHIGSRSIWSEMPRTYPNKEKQSSLKYRGWTLVDLRNGRYACKDGTDVRVKVCRLRTPTSEALARYREIVDEREDQDA